MKKKIKIRTIKDIEFDDIVYFFKKLENSYKKKDNINISKNINRLINLLECFRTYKLLES